MIYQTTPQTKFINTGAGMARKRMALQYTFVDPAWQKGQETYTVV